MNDVSPLEPFLDLSSGERMPFPPELARIYGDLRIPSSIGRPTVIANVVTTLDGVVALGGTNRSGGRDISGSSPHDRIVMGLLRAIADVIVVGANTVRTSPRHRWTPESAFPALREEYQTLRAALRKPPVPDVVVVSASGDVSLDLPLFQVAQNRGTVVTTTEGARLLHARSWSGGPIVKAVSSAGPISAPAILQAAAKPATTVVLVEGGPRLFGQFLRDRCLDELFLTLAPQIAGRDSSTVRPGLVEGQSFAPEDARWGRLLSVKRAGSHLFLRYDLRA